MTFTHDIATNLRLLSVQAGVCGGALSAGLGAFQGVTAAAHLAVAVPNWLFIAAGLLTAVGVFAGRMWPQPGVVRR